MKLSRSVLLVLCLSIIAVAAQAQVNSLSLVSDPGDFVGQGQTLFLVPDNGITATGTSSSGVVQVFFFTSSGEFWFLDFAAPIGQPLAAGTYSGAALYPFEAPGQPGLSVSGDGRGCSTITGSFTVVEIGYLSNGNVGSLDATFEQHCDGAAPALRGELKFNAPFPLFLTAPSVRTVVENQNLTFTVTATDQLSLIAALTASGLPAGASFTDNGNNTGTFTWTPATSQAGIYFLTFHGSDSAGNVAQTNTTIVVNAPPPPNDDFNQATVISQIPSTVTEDVTHATVAFDDPFCISRNQTVWFAFTPTQNMFLEANTFGSNYDTTLSVYTGSRGALNQIACNDDSNGTVQSRVRFNAVAGVTYYFEVSSFFSGVSANLVFNLLLGPPPLSLVPSVAQFGSVDPTTGAATISGFVVCSKQAFVNISGQLKQVHGGAPINGFFNTFVPCDGTTPWSATIQTIPTLFHGRSAALFTGGQANVSATATAFDFDNGVTVQQNLTVTITLRGKN
jgi:Putative Ig domain